MQGATTENTGLYLKEEQRRSAGCIAGRMHADSCKKALGPQVPIVCAAALIALLASSSIAAATQEDGPLQIPVRLVNGHVVVLTDLVGLRYTNEASFEISFEYPDTLTLHPDQYAWLGLDQKAVSAGTSPPVKLLIPSGITVTIPANEVAKESSAERVAFQNSMTKFYSAELGERKLKGTIGVGLLRKYFVTLDVSGNSLVLGPSPPDGDGEATTGGDALDVAFDYRDQRMVLNVAYANGADDRPSRMVLGGTEFDTAIDAEIASSLGRPAGDLRPVWLAGDGSGAGRIDVSQYAAFRPRRFAPTSDDNPTPLLVAGWNLLVNFRMEIDWGRQRLRLTQKRPPSYPVADFEFFRAESLGTADALAAFLERYPTERLSREAAALLLKWRLENDQASDNEVMNALAWTVRTSLAGRRTETCAEYVDLFRNMPGRAGLAIAAGLEGLKHSREAFDPRVVYMLHNEVGELYLAQGALNEAWRHFLSAAFMAPDDVGITLNLARAYERQGEVRRAYARFRKAASAAELSPSVAAEIKAALDRLRSRLAPDDPLLRAERRNSPKGRR